MVSIMVVIIEGAISLCMPVVFRAGVFITKALYGPMRDCATFHGRSSRHPDEKREREGCGSLPLPLFVSRIWMLVAMRASVARRRLRGAVRAGGAGGVAAGALT